MIKPIAVIGFLVVAFVVVLSFSNSSDIETDAKVITEEVDEEGQDFDFYVSVLGDLSIVETSIELPKSDQNDYDKYRDETNPPIVGTVTPTFTLETAAILLSATGDVVSKSSFLNIPLTPAILIDDRGNLLVGSSQIKFYGRTTEDAQLNVDGTVEFWLDDKLIATKKIFTKPDGMPRKTTELFLDDSIKSTVINIVPKTFTFKFTDEPFEDLSTHTYRVIVKDFSVETISQEVRKKYNWSGENLAYQLLINVDKSQITIQDEQNNAITVFKDDGRFIVCDIIGTTVKTPIIEVIRKTDNKVIATIDARKTSSTSNIIYEVNEQKNCAMFTELQRSTEYIFRMDGKDYEYQAPRIQQNVIVTCIPLYTRGQDTSLNYYDVYVGDRCESSFAKDWDFIYNHKEEKKIKINSIRFQVCGKEIPSVTTGRITGYANTWLATSQSPTLAAPTVKIYDGTNLIGETGGKTYCTALDKLPNNKELKIVISGLSEENIPAKTLMIKTPSINQYIEYKIECDYRHNGFSLARWDHGWSSYCTSNFGYDPIDAVFIYFTQESVYGIHVSPYALRTAIVLVSFEITDSSGNIIQPYKKEELDGYQPSPNYQKIKQYYVEYHLEKNEAYHVKVTGDYNTEFTLASNADKKVSYSCSRNQIQPNPNIPSNIYCNFPSG